MNIDIAIDIDKAILKISISIRRFQKISISIKYRIDYNLAYRTGLFYCLFCTFKNGVAGAKIANRRGNAKFIDIWFRIEVQPFIHRLNPFAFNSKERSTLTE